MMNIRTAFAILLACLVAGCATTPPPDVLRSADYGAYPENFESLIKGYVSGQLKDPESAQYQFMNAPKKGYWGLGGPKYGYVVCARINAKNSFGGYTGAKMNYFMIRDGQIIDATLASGGDYGEIYSSSKCKPYI